MDSNIFSTESPKNYSSKTICCFVVDVSGSMAGDPINALNKGLQDFHQEIKKDPIMMDQLEVALIEFSSTTETLLNPALAEDFMMPTLNVKGTTKMVDGVQKAISLVNDRKQWYKKTGQPYMRPWIILLTDGSPDRDQDVDGLALKIKGATQNKEFTFLPIGVEGADMNILNKIAGYTQNKETKNWQKMTPLSLDGLRFSDFFKWLSASLEMFTRSKEGDQINLPIPNWIQNLPI